MKYTTLFILLTILAGCNGLKEEKNKVDDVNKTVEAENTLLHPEEKHFKSLRQVTFGGDNAEAYWSFDDKNLVFQSNAGKWGLECDQIFVTPFDAVLDSQRPAMVSTGKGRTTCSYFMPDNQHIIYASTHLAGDACPEVPPRNADKYVWPIYDSFDIFVADMEGNITQQLTDTPGYDAEATVSPKGDKIVFTSIRSGDLELYTMNIDGTEVTQITDELGYDGGAFFSPDGTKIIFRASRPKTEEEIQEYKDLLKQGLVQPTLMELFICDADGGNLRQLTDLGKANWCPFFHPSGEKVIFASNYQSERGFPFNLYLINIDGTGLEKITHDDTFDAFPVFSNDGKHLAFSSNRNNGGTRDTNVFIAEWKD